MLKKIPVAQLQTGMYVHAMCGPWLSHDFWRTAFLIDKPELLQKLQASPLQEVWIDTVRGADIAAPAAPNALTAFSADTTPTTLAQELQRAAAICAQGQDVVQHIFSEARMGSAVETEAASALVRAICRSVQRHPNALISVARLKTTDNYTYMHSVAVCGLMVALAQNMGFSDARIQQAGMAGLLHDIGKAHSHLHILNKPGALTEAEFSHMKQHPVQGYAMLKDSVQDTEVLDACLHHHERLDGKGYPDGLQQDAISMLTRMTSICDVYDAITSDRPYKKGWPPSLALQRMAQWCHTQLDALVFETFVQTIGLYPVGSLVRLQSGLLGVVCAPAQHSMSTPQVAAFYHIELRRMLRPAKLLDLAQLPHESIVAVEDPRQWPFKNLERFWQKASRQMA